MDKPTAAAVQTSTGRILHLGAAVGRLAQALRDRTPSEVAVSYPLAPGKSRSADLPGDDPAVSAKVRHQAIFLRPPSHLHRSERRHTCRAGGADFNLRIGPSQTATLRMEYGSAFAREEEAALEVHGCDGISGPPRTSQITTQQLREAMQKPLTEIALGIRELVRTMSPQLAGDLAQQGVLLCGGPALTPGIAAFFSQTVGIPCRTASMPREAAAIGASILANDSDRWRGILL